MQGRLLKTYLDSLNVKQLTIVGIIAGAIIVTFIIGASLVEFPFVYDYGDSMSCPYDTYDASDFSLKACKSLYHDYTPGGESWYWIGRVSDLNKLNQLLVVYLVVQQKEAVISKFTLNLKLWVRARESEFGENQILINGDSLKRTIECNDDDPPTCTRTAIAVAPFLNHEEYDFFVSITNPSQNRRYLDSLVFRFVTVDPSYTKLLIGVKTTCLILSIIFAIFYRFQLRKFEDLAVPIDQRVLSMLGVALIFFNDPLYVFNIYTPNFALSAFSGIFVCSFLSFLLFYWLYSFQRVPELDDYKTETFTVGKAIFFGAFTVFLYVFYTFTLLEVKDKSYYWLPSKAILAFYILSALFLAAYSGWMVYSIAVACVKLPAGLFRKRVLLIMNIVGVLFTIGVIAGSVFQTYNMEGGAYIFFLGYFNVYVWLLLLFHMPTYEGIQNLREIRVQIGGVDSNELPREAIEMRDVRLDEKSEEQ